MGARRKIHKLKVGRFELHKLGVSGLEARDPYHLALTIGWPAFIAWLTGIYAAVTTVFAVIYSLLPGPISGMDLKVFRNAMFFSFEILSTSGYGTIRPEAVTARIIATVEIVIGLAFIAIMMGLVFVRFSRAKAKILFADKAVVATHNGKPTLMIRIGNGRPHAMTDAVAQLNAMVREVTQEGRDFFNIHELRLVRSTLPFFPLTITLMHEIDGTSPLHGLNAETLAARQWMLFLKVEARDPMLEAIVHELRYYGHDEIVLGARYIDAITLDDAGRPVADLEKISLIEPEETAPGPN